MDVDSGRVLAQSNSHRRMFPASTTKTLTALVAVSQGKLDNVVTVGANPPKWGNKVLTFAGRKISFARPGASRDD
jgi:D-alanyl-D-alanine carboxypeptidase (penicillin-binding protein 5/6)